MRFRFAAVVVLTGLLAGCSGEKTHPKAEVKLEGVTTHKKQVRPWTTAKAAKATTPTKKAPTPLAAMGVAEQVVKQLNDDRARLGLQPLKLDPTLMRLTQEYAVLLAKEGKGDAIPGGKNLPMRVQESGYAFKTLGTQVTVTRDPPTAATVTGFLKQPNIAPSLANSVDIGIGIAPGADATNFVVVAHAIR